MKIENRQQVINSLATMKNSADRMAIQVAAALIVKTVMPSGDSNPGTEYYRLKAEGWLSMLLASEPDMQLDHLADRVRNLSSVSDKIKMEIGCFASRLQILAAEPSDSAQHN